MIRACGISLGLLLLLLAACAPAEPTAFVHFVDSPAVLAATCRENNIPPSCQGLAVARGGGSWDVYVPSGDYRTLGDLTGCVLGHELGHAVCGAFHAP